MAHFIAGTSGWSYPQWRRGLYAGCPSSRWLSCYAQAFPCVELNGSFYRLPAVATIERWVNQTPPDFRFAAKAWRGITHHARLRDADAALAECLGLFRRFGSKLGPVLFQLPPGLRCDETLLADFLALLPQDMETIFEFRHASWNNDRIFALLEKHRAALCHAHMKEWLGPRVLTAPLLYLRLHGSEAWFKGGYSDAFLRDLAAWMHNSGATHGYAFFNNTLHENDAPENAAALNRFLIE